jgi:hypothetical protein
LNAIARAINFTKIKLKALYAKAVEITRAAKITGCSATYVSQSTCDTECPFLNAGCFAESGPVSWHAPDKLREADAVEALTQEARLIDTLSGQRPLRLHVVGDATSNETAAMLARSSGEYSKRWNMPVFTYTHAWRHIDRESWGEISVLASCETVEDTHLAMQKGYAAAIVRPDPPLAARAMKHNGIRELPCVHETRDVPCISCGLCWDDKRLREKKIVIRFTAHGRRSKTVATTLRSMQ